MRVLVTGGAGFIGSTLVDRLVTQGHEVAVIDDLSTGRLENLADGFRLGDIEHLKLDIAGPELAKAVAEYQPEVVHHLAAQIDVRHSVADPVADARINVLGSLAVATAAAAAGARRLVFAASGGTAYGEPDPGSLPVSERTPGSTTSPYGVAKRAVEDYLGTFEKLYGLETVSLRLGNVYGPRQDPNGEAGVVAIFCNNLAQDKPITVFGDGCQTRDYAYVDDVVDAFVKAGSVPGARGRFNIASGIETSLLELYDTLREVTGRGPEPTFAPARAGELRRVALDPGRAADVLGWRAVTPLRDGLARTWHWVAEHLGLASKVQA
jgi:UDP-glucose 4-epimerase